jgi:hypothetical protein
VAGSCEFSNEPSGSVKLWDFPDSLRTSLLLLKKTLIRGVRDVKIALPSVTYTQNFSP